jgi:hypothetical protein
MSTQFLEFVNFPPLPPCLRPLADLLINASLWQASCYADVC